MDNFGKDLGRFCTVSLLSKDEFLLTALVMDELGEA